MALFTDGPAADIEYLRSYESSVLDVAETEGIDLDAKLALAAEEIGDRILRFLLDGSSSDKRQQRLKTGVSDVIMTSPLRRWHAAKTLENVYRDAFGHQLNERYEQKLREYSELARRTVEEFFQIGVGLVNQPVPKAGSPVVASNGTDPRTCYVRVSWVNTQGAEGGACEIVTLNLGAGAVLEAPGDSISNPGFGWNIYAGTTPGRLVLQNASPLGITEVWNHSGALATQGRLAASGQAADYFVVDHQGMRRG